MAQAGLTARVSARCPTRRWTPGTRAGAGCAASCCARSTTTGTSSSRCSTGSSGPSAGGVDAASRSTPLTTLAAMRRGPAARRRPRLRCSPGPVVGADPPRARTPCCRGRPVTAAELRARADAALAEGRHGDAVVDGFRALAVRQVERGRLDDAPGATAHEVAAALGAAYPAAARPRSTRSAALFERVLYGDRPATPGPGRGRPGARRRAGGAAVSRAGGWVRERRSAALVVAAALVAAVVAVLVLGPRRRAHAGPPSTPTTPAPTGRAPWPACWPTGASTSPWSAAPTRSRRPAPERATTVVVTSAERLGAQHQPPAARRHARRRPGRGRPGAGHPGSLGVVGAGRCRSSSTGRAGAGCADPAYDGLRLEVDPPLAYAGPGGCFRGEGGALLAEPRPGLVLLGRRAGAHQRPGAARRQRRRRRCGCSGSDDRLVWYVPDARRPGRRRRRQPGHAAPPVAAPRPVARSAWPRVALVLWRAPPARPAGHRAAARSSSRPSRPPAAGAGSTAGPATAPTPPRRCAPPPGPALAERLRLPPGRRPDAAGRATSPGTLDRPVDERRRAARPDGAPRRPPTTT